jgi:hypothetical protein
MNTFHPFDCRPHRTHLHAIRAQNAHTKVIEISARVHVGTAMRCMEPVGSPTVQALSSHPQQAQPKVSLRGSALHRVKEREITRAGEVSLDGIPVLAQSRVSTGTGTR